MASPSTAATGSPSVAARWAWRALGLSVAALTTVSIGWVALAVRHGSVLLHESGVLTGLAMHAAAGLFYPPLVGPTGYGGTRYGPGQILAQAGLIRLGVAPLVAGQLLTAAATAALWAGMYRLLRLAAAPPVVAAAAPLLLFVSPGTREALAGVRPDLIPAALAVWGLAVGTVVARSDRFRPGLLAGAAALFSLALLTKFTDGFALIAAATLVAIHRRPRSSAILLLATGALTGLGMLACNAASGGRLWENFHACADPGGLPRLGLRRWLALLAEVFLRNDWPALLLLPVAAGCWLAGPRSLRFGPAGLFLLAALAMLPPMFFSPGMSNNHLVDLHVAEALVVGTALGTALATASGRGVATAAATTAVVLLSLGQLCQRVVLARPLYGRPDALRQAVARAGPATRPGPVLSDDAMVPVALGQRPFLLDDFMFPAIRTARPDAQADLYRRLDSAFFPVVVLRHDPDAPDRRRTLGDRFPVELHAHYDLVSHTTRWDQLWVYRPKPS